MRVAEIRRCPVKSMQGESPSEVSVDATGVVGDRVGLAPEEFVVALQTGHTSAGEAVSPGPRRRVDLAPGRKFRSQRQFDSQRRYCIAVGG